LTDANPENRLWLATMTIECVVAAPTITKADQLARCSEVCVAAIQDRVNLNVEIAGKITSVHDLPDGWTPTEIPYCYGSDAPITSYLKGCRD